MGVVSSIGSLMGVAKESDVLVAGFGSSSLGAYNINNGIQLQLKSTIQIDVHYNYTVPNFT